MVEWIGRGLGIAAAVLVIREALRAEQREGLLVGGEAGHLGGAAGSAVRSGRTESGKTSHVLGLLARHGRHAGEAIGHEARTFWQEAREVYRMESPPAAPEPASALRAVSAGSKGGQKRRPGRPRKTPEIAAEAPPGAAALCHLSRPADVHRFGRCETCQRRWYEHA